MGHRSLEGDAAARRGDRGRRAGGGCRRRSAPPALTVAARTAAVAVRAGARQAQPALVCAGAPPGSRSRLQRRRRPRRGVVRDADLARVAARPRGRRGAGDRVGHGLGALAHARLAAGCRGLRAMRSHRQALLRLAIAFLAALVDDGDPAALRRRPRRQVRRVHGVARLPGPHRPGALRQRRRRRRTWPAARRERLRPVRRVDPPGRRRSPTTASTRTAAARTCRCATSRRRRTRASRCPTSSSATTGTSCSSRSIRPLT